MQRIALVGMLMMGLGLFAPAPLQAEPEEFWLCKQRGGEETYTNRHEGQNCKKYEPKAKLVVKSKVAAGSPAEPVSEVNEYTAFPGIVRHDPPVKRLPGEINFETYRMLSTGTTEAEILTRAGQPRYTFRIARGTWMWVYLNDEWLVEVTFSGGRVANISRYRPTP
jgi:hypothetical protein